MASRAGEVRGENMPVFDDDGVMPGVTEGRGPVDDGPLSPMYGEVEAAITAAAVACISSCCRCSNPSCS